VVQLAATANVSRPSVYDILAKLKLRGLVESKIYKGKKRWQLASARDLSETLYTLKKDLLGLTDGREEVGAVQGGAVVMYQGDAAVRQKVFEIFATRHDERFIGYLGLDENLAGWFSMFNAEEISSLNRLIKKQSLITEAVFPTGWVTEMFARQGLTWAKDYEGRTAAASYIDPAYFDNGGQLFAFKDVVYLIALKDKLMIELRHSELQKMILTFYRFMREHGRAFDLNGELRRLIEKSEATTK